VSFELTLILALVLVALAGGALMFAARGRDSTRWDRLLSETATARQASESVERRFDEMRRSIEERVQGVERRLSEEHRDVADNLGQMREKMGMVFEASQKIERLATGMTRLEDLLKPPKMRGTLGETFLEQALRQVLAQRFWKMPYRFPDGVIVDAAIFVGDRCVPVDSKFPLENFRRSHEAPEEAERRRAAREFASDVRRHIEAIRTKYIRPERGTFDFAIMYVPAEAVYSEIAGEGEEEISLADYAVERRVVPVSPRLFYAYLATVSMGLRGLELQEGAREVQSQLADLARQWDRFEAPFARLGVHLANTQKQFEESAKALSKFSGRLSSIAGGADEKLEIERELEPPVLLERKVEN
jgi:DNA recombination protein RmuC